MGLFDELAGQVLGQGGGGSAVRHILEMVNNQPGGLPGLVSRFQEGGLGEVVSSWVGTGQNLPINAGQLQSVLGSDLVGQLAGKLGVSPEAAGGQLAELLPGVVDKLTPGGQMPQGDLMSSGMDLLKGFLE